MQYIDLETWPRKSLVEKYSTYVFPYINIGAQIDVTKLYEYAKRNHISFYCAMIYGATKIALEIENFKYRLVDGKPVICDSLTPVFTYLPKGEEQFYVVEQPFEEDMLSFCEKAKTTAEALAAQKEHSFMYGAGETEILYISCIPWINYTHFVRTIEDASKDNVPRISWGKYVRDRDGRLMMSFSVQVHHALMDGYHVGMYFEKLEAWLSSIPEQTSGKDGISDERSTVQ